ncbi:cell wall-active antibiotics response protein LiaF [Niallia sp. FSL W8-0635]|uniref:cell wall-active antibiotics response protein LiaF n=1 Tax=Niallia sp. FSL W8-0635 TaxID=2975337 RepID=UPI002B00F6DD|nr:cell wall-active antibiotics response protein [Yersinia enterocolitica]
MFKQLKGQYANWVYVVGGFLLLELFVFNPGLIFSLLVSIGMMYIAKKSLQGGIGKILFWVGLLLLIVSILNMVTVKIVLLTILAYYLFQLFQKKNTTDVIKPIIKDKETEAPTEEPILKKKALFTNSFYNRNITPDHVYEWNDINIQCGITNTMVDLSYTVLPEGETVIMIKNIVGDVKLYIPYDMEISINHSILFGSYQIFGEVEENVWNQNVSIRTAHFDHAETRVKIFTSFIAGSLEVKRI